MNFSRPRWMIRNTKQRDAIRRDPGGGPTAQCGGGVKPCRPPCTRSGRSDRLPDLHAFLEEGSVVAVPIPGEPPRYESRDAASRHHHHFHCGGCGRVFDVPGCPQGLDHWPRPVSRSKATTCCSMANVRTAPDPRASEPAGSLSVVKASDGGSSGVPAAVLEDSS